MLGMNNYCEPIFKVIDAKIEDVITTSGEAIEQSGSGSTYTPGHYDTPIIIIPH
jgi:hypothetical protein